MVISCPSFSIIVTLNSCSTSGCSTRTFFNCINQNWTKYFRSYGRVPAILWKICEVSTQRRAVFFVSLCWKLLLNPFLLRGWIKLMWDLQWYEVEDNSGWRSGIYKRKQTSCGGRQKKVNTHAASLREMNASTNQID